MSFVLANATVKQIIQEDPAFVLQWAYEDDTVEKVLTILKEHKISSLPVVERKGDTPVGTIDILDLVTFAVTKFAIVSTLAQESYDAMQQFNKQQIGALMNISGRDQWHQVSYKKPLSDLLSMLSNPHIHRVAVVNEMSDIVGFVSQSKIIQFFHKQQDKLEPSLKKLLQDTIEHWLPKDRHPVVTINMKHFMIDAFKLIWENEVSGVGVVDDNGKLVANISASDLKKLHISPIGPLIHDLYQPIKEFLHIRGSVEDRVKLANFPNPAPLVVQPNDTMTKVLDDIVKNKVHRVFLVDDQGRASGVISLCDIIARFLERGESQVV